MSQETSNAINLANQLLADLTEIQQQETPTAEVEIQIDAIRPGFKFKFVARRLDLLTFLYNGSLPEVLAAELMAATAEQSDRLAEILTLSENRREKLTGLDQAKLMNFQRMLAVQVCVAPKLVEGPALNAGEVSLATLPFAGHIVVALFHYALMLSPGVPVPVEGEKEVDLQQVKNFPSDPALSNAGPDGQKRGDADQQAHATQG